MSDQSPALRRAGTMDERSARKVTLLEAFETVRPAGASWSEDDRHWADRVALLAADPAPTTAAAGFIAERARHALQRLAPREPAAARIASAKPWPVGWSAVVVLVAFACGLAADSIGASQRVNLLAPPLWGVLLWNLAVYVVLVVLPLAQLLRGPQPTRNPLAHALQVLLRVRRRVPRPSTSGSTAALQRFVALWSARSRVLALLRAETVLHAAAAALGLGLIAGLYARGLVLDYRAVWESTFLSPAAAHALVTTLLAPAAALSGIALPDAAGFAALRVSAAGGAVGAPAAPWIHLLALTLLGFVVLPRVALALVCALRVRLRALRFALPLAEPYFQRLARLQRGSAAHVVVRPYGRTPSPQATLGLQALFVDAFGPRAALEIAPTVAFGDEEEAPLDGVPRGTAIRGSGARERDGVRMDHGVTHAVVLFDLSATPEPEHHGRFIVRVGAALPRGAALAVLIDEAAFARRFSHLEGRLEQRREAWRRACAELGATAVCIDLESADAVRAESQLQGAFAAPKVLLG